MSRSQDLTLTFKDPKIQSHSHAAVLPTSVHESAASRQKLYGESAGALNLHCLSRKGIRNLKVAVVIACTVTSALQNTSLQPSGTT